MSPFASPKNADDKALICRGVVQQQPPLRQPSRNSAASERSVAGVPLEQGGEQTQAPNPLYDGPPPSKDEASLIDLQRFLSGLQSGWLYNETARDLDYELRLKIVQMRARMAERREIAKQQQQQQQQQEEGEKEEEEEEEEEEMLARGGEWEQEEPTRAESPAASLPPVSKAYRRREAWQDARDSSKKQKTVPAVGANEGRGGAAGGGRDGGSDGMLAYDKIATSVPTHRPTEGVAGRKGWSPGWYKETASVSIGSASSSGMGATQLPLPNEKQHRVDEWTRAEDAVLLELMQRGTSPTEASAEFARRDAASNADTFRSDHAIQSRYTQIAAESRAAAILVMETRSNLRFLYKE